MKSQAHSIRPVRQKPQKTTPPVIAKVPAAELQFPIVRLKPNSSQPASLACLKRLPSYLQMLHVLQAEGHEFVSGTVLAGVHNLEPVVVRKDLSVTGVVGTPRVGFGVLELMAAIERYLGWDSQTKAVLIGVGNLGRALLGYQGFDDFGLRIVGAFDCSSKLAGQWVHGRKVQPIDQLDRFVRRGEIVLGVLTVPGSEAQQTADHMVRAGIRGVWNFTPTKLQLPENVVMQKEDLAEGLAVLSHRLLHASKVGREQARDGDTQRG